MLKWSDNWDGEGSPAYAEGTWTRARDFLLANSTRLWQQRHIEAQVPQVLPGPDGSIDIHWQVGTRELLLNVPADQDAPATYYGDSQMGEVVKGHMVLSRPNEWLLFWLAE